MKMKWTLDNVPPYGDPRITYDWRTPTGNPEDWTTHREQLGNYESYEELEYEADCIEYRVFDGGVTLLIDGDPVCSVAFSIYESDEHTEDETPSDFDVYSQFIELLKNKKE